MYLEDNLKNKTTTLNDNPKEIMCTVCGGTGQHDSFIECLVCDGKGSIDASLFTCFNCRLSSVCVYAYDLYNTNNRCLVNNV